MPNNNQQVIDQNITLDVLRKLSGDMLWENAFQPSTHNNLTNNKFRFLLTRCPTVSYFCQRANVPSLGFGTTIQSSSSGVPIRRPGTSYVYEDLQIAFAVDENMTNWLELHNWIKNLGVSYDKDKESLVEFQKTASAYLIILNSAYRPIVNVKFKNIYPTFLSALDFDSSNTDTETMIASATFAYTHYEIETLSNPA